MFLAGLTQGAAEGIKSSVQGGIDREKMQMLRAEADQKRQAFNMQQEKGGLEMQQIKAQMKAQEATTRKANMLQQRDITYKYLENYVGQENANPKYLTTALVQNGAVNKALANSEVLKTNLGQITNVIDNQDGTYTLQNTLQGKSQTVPEDLVLSAVGFLSKADEVEIEERKAAIQRKKERLGLLKTKAEINKIGAETKKINTETKTEENKQVEAAQKLQAEKKEKDIYKIFTDVANGNDVGDLNKASNVIKYDKEKMSILAKDKKYTETNTHLSLYDAASDSEKEIDTLAEGLMNNPLQTLEKKGTNITGYALSPERAAKIDAANTMSTKLMLLTMDYLQYKSGAAFGEVELKGYQQATGSADFTDARAAKAYIRGFVEYLGKRANSKIEENVSPEAKIMLKARKANIDKYKDIKKDDIIDVGGKDMQVVGWDADGKPIVKTVKKDN